MIRRPLVAAAFLVLVSVGCSGSDDGASPVATTGSTEGPTNSESTAPSNSSSTGSDAANTSEPVDTPDTVTPTSVAEPVIDVVNQPGEGEYAGALDDVSDQQCALEGGQWLATGTVTNPTDADAGYRVYVSFLDAAGETVGLVENDLEPVPPGESAEYSAGLDTATEGLQCILRVERRVS
jgi:hypothetical protein